ncbi:MAG: FixG Ig-like domain-containing protein [Chloroflexota bacterium]|nr:FixG Ig-like domain-containing protein [Chloroflexota bacterium]
MSPGETAEFELTIRNKEELAHNFTIATSQPREEERREGRAQFPDDSWISFSSQEIEVAANSEANVTVTVAIPREQKWAGEDWEIWLGVTAESSDLLAVKLYVRLLVSTNPAAGARPNAGLVAGIAVAVILLGCGIYYYFRRKTKPG